MKLKLSEDRRFLTDETAAPFLWLGDTAWELFHRLDREETELYLQTRRDQGFTVIQAVLLAEMDGLDKPNRYGRRPLMKNGRGLYDPMLPDTCEGENHYSYWDHVDYTIGRAEELGLVIALLPTWGDKYNKLKNSIGPEVFTKENALAYGRWLGERYREQDNIVWVLGGDRHLTCARHYDVNRALAQGLREAGDGKLITFHPRGNSSSSDCVHEEGWLDFNMIQSGHGEFVTKSYEMILRDRTLMPVKPVVEGEPKYEDHPACFRSANGYFDAFDTRKAAYWALFSGALGVTYGHSCVWGMIADGETNDYHFLTWKEALRRPGAENYRIMAAFLRGQGFPNRTPAQEALAENYEGDLYLAASRSGTSLLVYSPYGLPIRLKDPHGQGARWFNPRSGDITPAQEERGLFRCPSRGRGEDWVLIVA